MAAVSKVSLGGQISGSGAFTSTFATDNAMFLKVFAGEVLTAFMEKNVMLPLTRVRTINSGKSAQFPITGKASSGYHVPGRDILVDNDADAAAHLNTMKVAERIINIDDLLTSNVFIDSLDEAKSHFDYRGPFAAELGRALAYQIDKNLMKMVFQAASETGLSAPLLDGMGAVALGAVTAPAITTAAMIGAFYEAAQKMDENDLPEDGRWAVLEPELYYRLLQKAGTMGNAINVDYGGQGSVATGVIMQIAGIKIFKSNHIKDVRAESDPNHDGTGATTTASAGENNDYAADYTPLGGLFGHEECVGTVKLRDIMMESDYLINRQGTLFVAKMAMGHGILRADAAGYFALTA
jgi:hypothetical protein